MTATCCICSRELPSKRRTFCSAACSSIYYGPKRSRTLRDQVARDLFLARETYARQDPKDHDLAVRIVYLDMWLRELLAKGSGLDLAHKPAAAHGAAEAQLGLPGVA